MKKRTRKKKLPRRILRWGWTILLVLFTLSLLQVSLLRFINPPFTATMAWDWIENRRASRLIVLQKSWKPLRDISPHIRKAVLASEDQRFLSHHGFDFSEMNQAIKDIVLKKGYRGASTITMQAARTVFLWPERSWLRKAAEAYYTVLIEIFWSKERILEIYLNTVDWGPSLLGVEAASRRYFHVSCCCISRSQAASLAAILPSPHKWSPINPGADALRRRNRILKDMEKMPLLS